MKWLKCLLLAAILAAAGVSIGRGALQSVIHRSYLTAAAPGVLALVAVVAATLAVCWLLMNFFVEPVLVFVEWVPEVLVSGAAIRGRFWELVNAASKPVSFITAEMAELRMWGIILRCGVIAALIGGVMTLLGARFPKENGANQ